MFNESFGKFGSSLLGSQAWIGGAFECNPPQSSSLFGTKVPRLSIKGLHCPRIPHKQAFLLFLLLKESKYFLVTYFACMKDRDFVF